jgi:predicted transcriptional regulator
MNGQPYTVRRDGAATYLLDKFETLLKKSETIEKEKLNYEEAKQIIAQAISAGKIKKPKETKLKQLTCTICGKEFYGRFTKYCSNSCWHRATYKSTMNIIDATCVWCGKGFKKTRAKKTCSVECSYERTKQNDRTRKR